MSRIGRMPVKIPGGVKVEIEGTRVSVKGPKGELEKTFPDMLTIQMQEGSVVVARPGDAPSVRALHGMTRAMISFARKCFTCSGANTICASGLS